MSILTEEDIQDRILLKQLYDKRKVNYRTKEAFFNFEDQKFCIAQGRETFIIKSQDMAVGYPLFMNGELDFYKFDKALSILRNIEGRNITDLWDIGANIGSISIPAASRKLVNRITAFEPDIELFKLLRINALLNDVDTQFEFHNIAAGESEQVAKLMVNEGNTGDYRISGRHFDDDSMGEASRELRDVIVKPLDVFRANFRTGSTLIFMDIQGYEGIALKGARNILSTSPPLVIEFWPYGMKRQESYKSLRESVCSGVYKKMMNLSSPEEGFIPLSPNQLDTQYNKIGEDSGSFTDLMFV